MQVHLICADAGNDTGVPGYEDIIYTTRPSAPDTTPPSSVTGFTASAGEERATLNWTNPPDADFSSTVIRMSTAGYPATPWAGAYVAEQYAAPGSAGPVTSPRSPWTGT